MSKAFAAITSAITYLFVTVSVYAADDEILLGGDDQFVGTDVSVSAVPKLIISLIFGLAVFLAVVYLMFGGIKYMTARGDKAAVESARKHLFSAVIGLVIVVGTFFILNVVFSLLGVNNPLEDGWTLPNLRDLSD